MFTYDTFWFERYTCKRNKYLVHIHIVVLHFWVEKNTIKSLGASSNIICGQDDTRIGMGFFFSVVVTCFVYPSLMDLTVTKQFVETRVEIYDRSDWAAAIVTPRFTDDSRSIITIITLIIILVILITQVTNLLAEISDLLFTDTVHRGTYFFVWSLVTIYQYT